MRTYTDQAISDLARSMSVRHCEPGGDVDAVVAADMLLYLLAELGDLREYPVQVARLRRELAARGAEDPAWSGLNARQKKVLAAADAALLAEVRR